jgi:hypothetical protein
MIGKPGHSQSQASVQHRASGVINLTIYFLKAIIIGVLNLTFEIIVLGLNE